jgi:hypothetical protein
MTAGGREDPGAEIGVICSAFTRWIGCQALATVPAGEAAGGEGRPRRLGPSARAITVASAGAGAAESCRCRKSNHGRERIGPGFRAMAF